jgi:hypothetical protein
MTDDERVTDGGEALRVGRDTPAVRTDGGVAEVADDHPVERIDAEEEPIEVLVQLDDVAVQHEHTLEHGIPVDEPPIPDRHGRLAPQIELAVDVDPRIVQLLHRLLVIHGVHRSGGGISLVTDSTAVPRGCRRPVK